MLTDKELKEIEAWYCDYLLHSSFPTRNDIRMGHRKLLVWLISGGLFTLLDDLDSQKAITDAAKKVRAIQSCMYEVSKGTCKLAEIMAEREKWKERAEALESALWQFDWRNHPTKCNTCRLSYPGCQGNGYGQGRECNLWEFDVARFAGKDGQS